MLTKRVKMLIKILLIFIVVAFLLYKIADSMYYKYLFRNSDAEDKAITRVLSNKFNLDKVIKISRLSPPVMGGVMNYYVTFKDKSNNDCFIIMDLRMRKYLLIYENKIINQQKDSIIKQHEKLINQLLSSPYHKQVNGPDRSLNSIVVKKCNSNAEDFKSGEIVIAEILFKSQPLTPEQKKQSESNPFHDGIGLYFIDSKTEDYFVLDMVLINKVKGVKENEP